MKIKERRRKIRVLESTRNGVTTVIKVIRVTTIITVILVITLAKVINIATTTIVTVTAMIAALTMTRVAGSNYSSHCEQ